MSGSSTLRMEPVAAEPPALDPAAFRAGRDPEDAAAALIDRVAFALAVERRTPPSTEALTQLRNEATVAATSFAFRHLHNTMAEIRQQAVAEHLAGLRKPPTFGAMVLAALLGSLPVAAAALWLAAHPERLAALFG